jgi:NADH:ubiquinone oxidoreductase subunit 6 (subunit J)
LSPRSNPRSTVWIWFVGFAVWLFDGLLHLHYHNWVHARLALMIALLFLAAGFFYRRQS